MLIFIIELCSGLTGIGAALTLANAVIHAVTGSANVNDSLPVTSAVLLIELSIILTIGGLIPSKKVARKDPVTVSAQGQKCFCYGVAVRMAKRNGNLYKLPDRKLLTGTIS